MNILKLFIPITKVDAVKREVWGRAAEDVADKAGEIMDYPTSKPFFQEWSAEFERVTDGQSLGNLRAMHSKVAAGKLIAFAANDAEKAFDVGTKIVDDQEWEKVLEGVYTGFSVGGSYVKKWKDGELTRYTAKPHEISLVDSPCIPTARFSLVKADGTVEEKPFAIKKGLYTVARLAALIMEIDYLHDEAEYETSSEGDMSPIPDELKAWCESGCAILRAMVAEETAELTADKATEAADLEKQATADELVKATQILAKVHNALAKATEALTKATAENEGLKKRVEELEKQPAPAKGRLKVIEKAQDLGGEAEEQGEEPKTALDGIKKALRSPIRP